MDQRIESFLADVLALAGENPDAIREGVRVALADCEAIFRAQEPNKGIGASETLSYRVGAVQHRSRGQGDAPA